MASAGTREESSLKASDEHADRHQRDDEERGLSAAEIPPEDERAHEPASGTPTAQVAASRQPPRAR